MNQKIYLGDNVYVSFDGYSLTLTTENGLPYDPTNRIVLELPVYENLTAYVESLKKDPIMSGDAISEKF